MAYTYLITGATSDVGRTLIERLLHNAPADTLVLAQGCGDLAKMAELCRRYPGQLRTYDVDLSDRAKVDAFVEVLAADAPAPTHFIHLPALPVVNTKFKAFDQRRFDLDLEIEVHSAVRICKAVLPAMARAKFGRVLFIQTSYTIGCPPRKHCRLCDGQERYRRTGEEPGRGVRQVRHHGQLRGPQHDGDPFSERHPRPHRAGGCRGQPYGSQRHPGRRGARYGVPALG